ncbi:MAG: SMC family ATPase, partial [Chloroflexi bacterium]|nr:SMC family ATPase [Chloroflexota bacterium]
MIPVSLRLRNFMCYGDAVLDLDGVHIACLCGENGSGKSALLDAITWVLWGKARGRTIEDLVRLGQTDMEVALEFLAEGARYRVLRKYARSRGKGRTGASDAALEAVDESGRSHALAGSVRETDARVLSLLRMDYETFINSAFLMQGRADLFTVKDPAQRKQVLADILGLGQYDRLEEIAKSHARDHEALRERLEVEVERVRQELERRPGVEQELQSAQDSLYSTETAWFTQSQEFERVKAERLALQHSQSQLQEVQARIQSTQRELAAQEQQRQRAQAALAGYAAVLSKRTEIEQGYLQYQEAQRRRESLDMAFQRHSALRERSLQLQAALGRAQASLEAERKAVAHRVADVEREGKGLPALEAELERVRGQAETLATRREELAAPRTALDEKSTLLSQLAAANDQLKREMLEIRAKMDQLQTTGEGECPLCGTPLSQDRCQGILGSYQSQGEERKAQHQRNAQEMARVKRERDTIASQLKASEAQLEREAAALERRRGAVEGDVARAHKAAEVLAQEQARLASLQETLAKEQYATEERRELVALTAQVQAAGYDAQTHQSAREQAASLQPFEARWREVQQAASLQPQLEEQLVQATESSKRLVATLADEQAKERQLAAALAGAPQVEARFAQAQAEVKRLESERNAKRDAVVRLQAEAARLSELETEVKGKEAQRLRIAEEEGLYKELAQAFGKQGVQALIIEQALPEIEEEANALLARMTNNRMHLRLETQRALASKKGEYRETLDIHISDELGTRGYEMYSGGEAFRINFALRIALSRLLARRAGAALPTRFIDE